MAIGARVCFGSLWVVVLVLVGMIESGVTQMLNPENSLMPLGQCDFHFKGHRSVPPVVDLQNPGTNALSSSIITRGGEALISAETGKECLFPGADNIGQSDETAAICAQHFQMQQDKMLTTAQDNVTEWDMTVLKGRHVLLPLVAVDFFDGMQLRPADGNVMFPEERRCVSFFTASDVTTILDKMLNKVHRKRLSKISMSAEAVRSNFNELLNKILQFPQ